VDAGLGAADDPGVQGSDFQEGECSFAVGFPYFILVNWVVLRAACPNIVFDDLVLTYQIGFTTSPVREYIRCIHPQPTLP
jgi:hypothetical protein